VEQACPRKTRKNITVKYSSLLPITLIVFIDVLGFTIVIPLLPFYAEHLGASPATVGALVSVYAVCSLVAAPFLGRWSDRYGRKPVLLVSQFGTLSGFVMLALAPSLAWVFAARALDGLTAGNIVTARAYISDVTPPKERTQAFGLIAAAFGFGYLIGPAGAGMLAHYGQTVPLWIAAGLSATSILATQFLLPPTTIAAPKNPSTEPSPLSFLVAPGVSARLWQMFAFLLAFSCFTSGFALFCERRLRWHGAPFGTAEVGWVLAYIGLLGLTLQLGLLRPLVARFGEARLVSGGFVAVGCGYAALGLAHSLPWLLLCLTFSGLANGLLRPCLLGLISLQVAPSRQGAVNGVTQSLQSIAMIAGPLISGGLIEIGWLAGWALACAALALIALILPRLRR
jgi:MFS family permease